jgi:hypothetical protein
LYRSVTKLHASHIDREMDRGNCTNVCHLVYLGLGRPMADTIPAGVSHADEHAIRGLSPGANPHLPRSLLDVPHGFGRVEDQVEDYLLRLDAVAINERQARRERNRSSLTSRTAGGRLAQTRMVHASLQGRAGCIRESCFGLKQTWD